MPAGGQYYAGYLTTLSGVVACKAEMMSLLIDEEMEAQAGYMASLRPLDKCQARVQVQSFLSLQPVVFPFASGCSKLNKK